MKSSEPSSAQLHPLRAIGRTRLLFVLMVTVVAVMLSLWVPSLVGDAVDSLTAGTLSGKKLWDTIWMLSAVVLAGTISSKIMRLLPMRIAPLISHNLRKQILEHLLHLDDAQMEKKRVGDLMTRINSDVPAISDMVALGGHSLLRALFSLGFAFTVMFRESRELAFVMLVLLPVLIMIGFLLLNGIRERYSDMQKQFSTISNFCQESFLGIRVIKGMGIEPQREARFHTLNQHYINLNLRVARIEIPAWPFMHFGFVFGSVLLLWIGGRLVIRDEITLGTLVEFQQYLMVLQWPTLSLSWTISLLMRGRASQARILEILRETPTLSDPELTEANSPSRGTNIVFDEVSLTLDGRTILNDIDLTIPEGSSIGITGPSGSGKSMLCHLLLRRFDPTQGRVLFGGLDLRNLPRREIQTRMRLAPQEPLLFSTTLADNLRFGDPDADDSRIRWALEVADLGDEVSEWPKGILTEIGERGITLSGGQRQRCGIARAILGNPEILLLDDCLAAVDTRTESHILQQLEPVMRNRTSIVVSHRFSALRGCDRILVLQDGRITEDGTPDALLSADGYFAELAERQRLQAQLEAMNS